MSENSAPAQVTSRGRVATELLEIAYEETGPADGTPVVLLHGFPYDARCVLRRLSGQNG